MTVVERFDHVGITVLDLRAAMAFFVSLGMKPDGDPQMAEGPWLGEVIGIENAQCEVVTLRAPGDSPGIELSQFHRGAEAGRRPRTATPDELGLRSIALQVDDVDAAVARVKQDGYELVNAVTNYADVFRLCYVRGPDQIIVILAERL